MSKYKLEKVYDLEEWDRFVGNSPQGTIFSYSYYLKLAVDDWELYWIKKGDQIKAGLSLVINPQKNAIIMDDLVIHNGLIFSVNREQKETKARLARFEITEFVIEWMSEKFNNIELSLSPRTEDMRPYLWYNYHSAEVSDKFALDLRYTSYLDISDINKGNEEETNIFRGLETLRQRNIREARREDSKTVTGSNGTTFVQSYALMMQEKDEPQSNDKLNRLERLIDGLVEKKKAIVYLTKNREGQNIYISVFGLDNKRAYYLFGAPVEGAKERYKGTISFWDAYRDLAERGVNIVDLEGVNSPQRGWYKLSFGGELISYYQISK